MSDKKMRVAFQKGVPNFIAKLKEQTGYQEPQLGDKFKLSTQQPTSKPSKQEQYDVEKAQIVTLPQDKVPEVDIVTKDFKPSFKLTDKKERNKAIVQNNIRKNKQKTSSFKMSSQTMQAFQERMELQKDRILHEKTKKIFKSNKNLLSFDD